MDWEKIVKVAEACKDFAKGHGLYSRAAIEPVLFNGVWCGMFVAHFETRDEPRVTCNTVLTESELAKDWWSILQKRLNAVAYDLQTLRAA